MTMDLRTREYFRLEEEEAQRISGGDFSEFINLYEREMISAKIDDRFGRRCACRGKIDVQLTPLPAAVHRGSRRAVSQFSDPVQRPSA